MILFVAPYPDSHNERDGMFQRVAAIDSAFADTERAYLLISFKRYLFPRVEKFAEKVTVYRVNLYLHFWYIAWLCRKASAVYVHSLYNAIRILPLYFFLPLVTDMHGLVPEELEMEGEFRSTYYGFVESIVAKKSKALVAVTNAMADFFTAKHALAHPRIFKVPIFDPQPPVTEKARSAGKYRVIYTGGTQKWQNVDLMIEAAKQKADDFDIVFLTGDRETFARKLSEAGIAEKVVLDTAPKKEIPTWYEAAHFGFVLRDDVAVNNVACPTKLIEYLAYGVVPIVIQPRIGDFASYGYSYVLLSDFLCGNLPDADQWEEMVRNNLRVIEHHRDVVAREMKELVSYVKSGMNTEEGKG